MIIKSYTIRVFFDRIRFFYRKKFRPLMIFMSGKRWSRVRLRYRSGFWIIIIIVYDILIIIFDFDIYFAILMMSCISCIFSTRLNISSFIVYYYHISKPKMYVLNITTIVDESYSMNSLIVIGFSFCHLSNSFFIKLYIIITISIVCSNINEYRIIAKFFNSIENRIS